MEYVIKFLSSYGWSSIVVAIITIILTGLVKSPIKSKMIERATKLGIDKKVFTAWLAFIPLVIAFIGSIVNIGLINGFKTSSSDYWVSVLTETFAVWSISVAFYENGVNFLKAVIGKTQTPSSSENKTLVAPKKKLTKVEKLQAKIDSINAKEQAKKEKEAEEAQAKADKAKAKAEAQSKELTDKANALLKQAQELKAKAEPVKHISPLL